VVGEPDKDANGRAKDPRDAGCAVMMKRSGWGTERPDEAGTAHESGSLQADHTGSDTANCEAPCTATSRSGAKRRSKGSDA